MFHGIVQIPSQGWTSLQGSPNTSGEVEWLFLSVSVGGIADCVTLGRLLTLSVLPFPHCKMSNAVTPVLVMSSGYNAVALNLPNAVNPKYSSPLWWIE